MVSSQNPTNGPTTEAAIGVMRTERGFVTAEPENAGLSRQYAGIPQYGQTSYFWGAVIAGTLFTVSFFVLSWLLMLGCHVGVTRAGLLSMGAGAAWWTIITAVVAFYLGGLIAGYISRPIGGGWLKGATVWGLSIPLALCICAIVSAGSGLLAGSTAPHISIMESANNVRAIGSQVVYSGISFGAIWTGFWSLLVGLFCAVAGSSSLIRQRSYADYSQPETVIP